MEKERLCGRREKVGVFMGVRNAISKRRCKTFNFELNTVVLPYGGKHLPSESSRWVRGSAVCTFELGQFVSTAVISTEKPLRNGSYQFVGRIGTLVPQQPKICTTLNNIYAAASLSCTFVFGEPSRTPPVIPLNRKLAFGLRDKTMGARTFCAKRSENVEDSLCHFEWASQHNKLDANVKLCNAILSVEKNGSYVVRERGVRTTGLINVP